MYVSEKYNYTVKPIYSRSNVWEGQFIEISGGDLRKKITIGNVYRPPRELRDYHQTFIEEFQQVLSILENGNGEVAICGDYNIDLLKVNERPIYHEYFDVIMSHSFCPKITFPTRFSNTRGTLIDNILCKISDVTLATSCIMVKKFLIISRISLVLICRENLVKPPK